jgi:arylsulfatase A-like enzyme
MVPAGETSAAPVCSIDLFPTILDACGVPLPKDRPIDGLSLLPHLKSGGNAALARDELLWHFPHYRHAPGPYSIIRKGDWKLIRFWEGQRELFNLRADLAEETNLAEALPGKVVELDAILAQRLKLQQAKLPRPNPNYVGN